MRTIEEIKAEICYDADDYQDKIRGLEWAYDKRIAELEAELAEARAALRRIASADNNRWRGENPVDIARRALARLPDASRDSPEPARDDTDSNPIFDEMGKTHQRQE